LQIIKNGSSFQMVTAPENAELIQQFVKDETTGELSRPSLETLTIIAYRGPVAKTDLDRIRGINCSLILRNLLIRGLVDVREDKKKDESYYTVTFDFLRFLGLNDVKELPDYQKLSQDDTIERILEDNPLAGKINNQQPLDLPEEVAAAEEKSREETDEGGDDQDDEEGDLAVVAVSSDGDAVVIAEVAACSDGKDAPEDENEELDEDEVGDDDDEFEDDEDESALVEATADKKDEDGDE